jgi:hypothetical protein
VPTKEESDIIIVCDMLAQVEAVPADVSLGVNGVHVDDAEPQSSDVTGGHASFPRPLVVRTWTTQGCGEARACLLVQAQVMRY